MVEKGKLVKAFVNKRIKELMHSVNEAAVRAKLAKLRQGIGKAPGSMPELWDVTLQGLPEALYSKTGEATYGEWAAYTALTLFALHQQGKDLHQNPMNKDGASLGMAVRRLVGSEVDEKRIKRRFDAAVTADDLAEFSYHLRGLVQLLKSKDIPLDYPTLANELYLFQTDDARDSVRLRWGQDFYRVTNQTESAEEAEAK